MKESEDRWKFAIDGSGDGLWDWDSISNKVYFSTQWKNMLGYDENDIGNELEEWSKRVHPEDLSQVYQDLNKHLSGEMDYYKNTHRVLCKDGSYKWILDRGKIVEKTEDGKPKRIIGTHRDVTEEIAIHNKIKESEENFRSFFNTIDDIFLIG